MASLRNAGRGLTSLLRSQQHAARRSVSTQAGKAYRRPIVVGACAGAATYGLYTQLKNRKGLPIIEAILPTPVVHAATPTTQPSVVSGTKDHALYLWIHVRTEADVKKCARVAANLQSHVDKVTPPDMRDETDEVIAGVGFGPAFYAKAAGKNYFGLFQVDGKTNEDYSFMTKSGVNGEMPAEGGDIFIHAKSNQTSKLFELAQLILGELPEGSVAKVVDVYGWVYKNGRDLSGFIDGTENPADDETRAEVAIEKSTGGSYVITQRWVHNLTKIKKTKDSTLEGLIGREIDDSTELKSKPITSHVARMTGGADFQQKTKFEIVRQSQPYGSLTGKAGLFFIAYAASPENFNYMLNRMVGAGTEDAYSDNIMQITSCEASTYWYFPSEAELNHLK